MFQRDKFYHLSLRARRGGVEPHAHGFARIPKSAEISECQAHDQDLTTIFSEDDVTNVKTHFEEVSDDSKNQLPSIFLAVALRLGFL